MSILWSKYIQTSEELYMTRALRFRPDNVQKWLPYTQIKNGMKIIEIGCAGGLLCHRIKDLLPGCEVYGMDWDTGHIAFAEKKGKELGLACNFVHGDATSLPFEDNLFDLAISHTVMEHVDPEQFLGEQYRILKKGGVITVMSVRSCLNVGSREAYQSADSEAVLALFERARLVSERFENENSVCKYNLSEGEIIGHFEQAGFKHIDVQFTSLDWYTPDNASISADIAERQIEAKRLLELAYIQKASVIQKDIFSEAEQALLVSAIHQKYDQRIEKYRSGEKVWDINISGLMIITGMKGD